MTIFLLLSCVLISIWIMEIYWVSKINKMLTNILERLTDTYYTYAEVSEEDRPMADGYNCAIDYALMVIKEESER